MAAEPAAPIPTLVVSTDQPLIGIPCEENGQQVVRCFTDEDAANSALAGAARGRRWQARGVTWIGKSSLNPSIGFGMRVSQPRQLSYEAVLE